ncbi:MAG: glycerophosphodiester phosphodiesterase family protein [Sphaerochaetaceae bacterium]
MSRKQNLRLISRVFFSLCSFGMLYALCMRLLISPALEWLYGLLLKAFGISYLSMSNITLCLSRPLLGLGVILIGFLSGYFLSLEIAGLVYLLSEAQKGRKATLLEALCFSFSSCLRLFIPCNWPLLLFSVALLPNLPIVFSTSIVGKLAIPKFITGALNTPLLLILYSAFIAAMVIVSVYGFFAYHVFFLEKTSAWKAYQKSASLIKGKAIRTAWSLLTSQLWGFLLTLLLIGLIAAPILINAYHNSYEMSSYFGIYLGLKSLLLVLITRVPIAFGYSWLTIAYIGKAESLKGSRTRISTILAFLILACLTALGCIASCLLSAEKAKQGPRASIEVIAHRGVSAQAPENTLPAFELAQLYRADWAETDVQLTRDKKLVLSHDATLKRMLGSDSKACELTLSEIQSYDIVNCPPQYKGLRLCTLEDILMQDRGSMKILIELKTQGGDEAMLAKAVLDCIKACGAESQCAVHSESLEALKAFRSLDRSIPIGWCTPIIKGELIDMDVDFLSLEQTYLKEDLIASAHKMGKKIYIWTVNYLTDIRACLEKGADGIITDNAQDARDVIQASTVVDAFIYDLINDQVDWEHLDY